MQSKQILGTKQDNCSPQRFGNKKSSNNIVKTPSLLFYRPNTSSVIKTKSTQGISQCQNSFAMDYKSQSQVSSYNSINVLRYPCQNHPHLSAKFTTKLQQQGEQNYFCQQCTYPLIDQGFQLTPLFQTLDQQKKFQSFFTSSRVKKDKNKYKKKDSFPFPQRKHQVENFLTHLSGTMYQIHQNNVQIRQILINSEEFYGKQIQQINDYFQTISHSLQLQKNKCYNYILLERQNAQKEVRQLMNKLNEGEKQINLMFSDIEENKQSVYSTSFHNYKLVMDAFKLKVTQINKILSDIRDKGIMDVEYRKIEFAGVSQSINSLSDIIIQNSYGSAHASDGTFLLTQNENLCRSSATNKNGKDRSILDKLKTERSCHSASNQDRNQSNLMFSFDGQKMRSCHNNKNSIQQQNINPLTRKSSNQSNSDQQIKLIKSKHSVYCGNQKLQTVSGIKQVQQLDALVTDDVSLITIPPNLRLAR